MPTPFTWYHDRIFNFKFEETDVVVMTWPKCGTTWMQEILWTMRNNPDLDSPMAQMPVNARVPFIEFDCLMQTDAIPPPEPDNPLRQLFNKMVPGGDPKDGVFVQMCEALGRPRSIKTHLPFSLMPKDMLDKAKVIYVMRNPKDVVTSYLHHCRLMRVQDFRGDLDQFVQQFVDGDLVYGPYDVHLKEAFARKSHPNLHIVKFEELKAEPLAHLRALDRFLGTGRSEEQLKKICHYTSFAEMKKRDTVIPKGKDGDEKSGNGHFNMDVMREDGGFFRKGEAGSWKEKLSPEQSQKIDKWTQEKLGEICKEFKYD